MVRIKDEIILIRSNESNEGGNFWSIDSEELHSRYIHPHLNPPSFPSGAREAGNRNVGTDRYDKYDGYDRHR